MKQVIQLERTGCGIASVAALAGVSYQAARRGAGCLGVRAKDDRLWSDTTHVRRLLKRYRLCASSGERPFRSWQALPKRSLLAIKWRRIKGRAYWHWVVCIRHGASTYVLDSNPSLKRHVRTDLARIKPKWFIAVTTQPSS